MMDPANEEQQLEVTGQGGLVDTETEDHQAQRTNDQGAEQDLVTTGEEVQQRTEQEESAEKEQGLEQEQGTEQGQETEQEQGQETEQEQGQEMEQEQGQETEQEQGQETEQEQGQETEQEQEQETEQEQGQETEQEQGQETEQEQGQETEQEQGQETEQEQGQETEQEQGHETEQEQGQETEQEQGQETEQELGQGTEPVEDQQTTQQENKEEAEQSEEKGETQEPQATEQSDAQEVEQVSQQEQEQQSGGMDQGTEKEKDETLDEDKTQQQETEQDPEQNVHVEYRTLTSTEQQDKEQLSFDDEKATETMTQKEIVEELPIPKLYAAVKGNNSEEVVRLLEEGEDANMRAMDGKTLLHLAVSINAEPTIFTALLDKMDDFTQRDENGDSVLEMIYSTDYSEKAEAALSDRVRQLIEGGDVEKLLPVVLAGWGLFPDIPDEIKGQSKEVADLLENLPQYKEKTATIHQGIQKDDSDILTILQYWSELCEACDRTGLPPLTKAIILGKEDLAKKIAIKFPDSLKVKDNLGRLPLHYAAVYPDNGQLYEALQGAGAADAQDQRGNTASVYKEKPELLDFQKVQERVQNILNKPPVTARVKQQVAESQGQSPLQGQDNGVEKAPSPQPDTAVEDKGYNSAYPAEEPPRTPEWLKQPKSGAPTSFEGQYLATTVGVALTRALAEIAERRPWDPIEYLAQYLYKFHADMKYLERKQVLEAELRAEMEEKERARALRAQQREEMARIRAEESRVLQEQAEEEERQRREQEEQERRVRELSLAQAPDLPTVKEETGEVEGDVRERDENGQTELHRLAAQPGKDSELLGLLNLGFSLADRDAQYRTARDIAEENDLEENVEVMDNYVANMIEGERLDDLQKLILDGYDKMHVILEKVSTEGLPDNVTTFINQIPELQAKVKDVIKAVRSGVVRNVSQVLTRKMFLSAKDNMGRTALHNAVLYNHKEVAEYIAESFPFTLKTRDTLNRTPLHYAAGLSDDLYDFIIQQGGNTTLKDAKGKIPGDYKLDKEEIIKLREEAPGIEITAPADEEDDDSQSKTENEDEENNSENTTEET